MKHWIRLASRLYPPAWRKRYAVEFDAMLDHMETGWTDFFDILKGALTMQFTFWNWKAIIVTFAGIGAVVAAAVALSIPNQYSSTSVVRITTASGFPESVRYLTSIEQQTLSRTSLEELITQLGLYRAQRSREPIEDIVAKMRNHDIAIKLIQTSNASHGTAFAIQTANSDPKLAQAVNRQLLSKFMQQSAALGKMTSIEVLDSSSLPTSPMSPHKEPLIFLGTGAGLAIGSIVALAMGWRIMIVRRSAS